MAALAVAVERSRYWTGVVHYTFVRKITAMVTLTLILLVGMFRYSSHTTGRVTFDDLVECVANFVSNSVLEIRDLQRCVRFIHSQDAVLE